MIRVSIPDDSPAVFAGSTAWSTLQTFAEISHFDSLPGEEARLIERISNAAAVLNVRASTRFTERVFAVCPTLRLISVWGTGTDHVDLAAAHRHGVNIASTPGVSSISIAEHALALLLAVARHIPSMDASTRRSEWERGRFVQLHGKTCGIIGYGAIGREFARLAAGIGMRVIAWTMHPERYPEAPLVSLDELFSTSDVISVHLRLSLETTGFIGPAQFSAMKRNAILINTARGPIIDERAMIHALSAGQIAGAGLDVYLTEPLPMDHPITDMGNVVLTPHCAGITPEAMEAGLRMAVENIRDLMPNSD